MDCSEIVAQIANQIFQVLVITRLYFEDVKSQEQPILKKLWFWTPRSFLITILAFSSLIFVYANYKASKSSSQRRKLLKDLSLRYVNTNQWTGGC